MPPRAPTFQLRSTDAGAADARREAMLEAALDAIVTMDADGLVVDLNAAAERTFGYAREEARGRRLGDLIVPPEQRERHEQGISRHLRTGSSTILGRRLELQAMRRDRSRIPVELTVTRSDVGGEPLFIGFLRDLSGLHATQAALEEAEARFRRLVEQVPVVTYICDYDEAVSIRYISPQIETMTGYPPERWTADPQFWTSVVHPDDREWVVGELARHTREQIPVDLEYRFVAADGSVVHLLDQETIVRDPEGAPLYSQGVLVDVSELRRTEARLLASEAQMSTIVESAPMVLFALDRDGVFTLSEGQALDLLGLEPGEVVGRSIFDVHATEPEIKTAARRALAGEHVSVLAEVGELVFDVAYSPVTGRGDGATAVIGVATDVTSRHRSEQALAHYAFHDRLTGLANRGLLEERLAVAVERAGKSRATVALLNLDLDDFKTVNDSSGTRRGTSCCARSRAGSSTASAPRTCSPATAATSSCCCSRTCRATAAPSPRRSPQSCWRSCGCRSTSAAPRCRSAPASASASTRPTRSTRPTCSSTPTPRCTRPSAPVAAATRSTAPPTTPRHADWSSRAGCAPRSPRASSGCISSPCASSPAEASSAPRRSCAGTTPSAGWSPRRSSSRWRRTPG